MFELIKPFNFILAADSYKCSHFSQIPPNVTNTCSTIVPRKLGEHCDKIVAMGQTLVAHILANVRITQWMIEEAEVEFHEQGYEFNRAGWQSIVDDFDGILPIEMYGVEEGRLIDPQTPIVSFIAAVNTTKYAWLVSYIETWAQEIIWKMSTVASDTRAMRNIIAEFIELTGSDPAVLNTRLHNFGDRGSDSPEEAPVMAGISHAALFDGSDCSRANGYIKVLYDTNKSYTTSVHATEHSTSCMNADAATKDDYNAAVMAVEELEKVVARTKRGIGIPVMSAVIDTYDSRRYVREYTGKLLKQRILDSGGVFVHRPDTGDATVEPGMVGKDIEATFGASKPNEKGYKDLHPQTGVLQGDSIRVGTIRGVLQGWVDAGFTINQFLMGIGGGLHEGSRDKFSFSQKAVAAHYQGAGWKHLLKDPITDRNKRSLSGLVKCYQDENGNLTVVDVINENHGINPIDEFRTTDVGHRCWVLPGRRMFRQSFDSVREYARS